MGLYFEILPVDSERLYEVRGRSQRRTGKIDRQWLHRPEAIRVQESIFARLKRAFESSHTQFNYYGPTEYRGEDIVRLRDELRYLRYFGAGIEEEVRRMIRDRHHGEILVGAADVVETANVNIPYHVVAPTMRVPMILNESVNAYLAARPVLLLIRYGRFAGGGLIRESVGRMAFPGLGTGVGQLSPNTCARQVRVAIDQVMLNRFPSRSRRHSASSHRRPRSDATTTAPAAAVSN